MSKQVKIRYKTDAQPNDILHWRVIVDGVEHHASEVLLWCPTYTTKDVIDELGTIKWHISCQATTIVWENDKCIIN